MKKILVLASTGMLGSMVFAYLQKNTNFAVTGTTRKKSDKAHFFFDVYDFLEAEKHYAKLKEFDYIINCIGIIKPYCKDNDPAGVLNAISVNALFPHKLAAFLADSKTKILQIATDCVYSGKKGKYTESDLHDALDVYGKTKSLGEAQSPNLLNIRCSIIGPEQGKHVSLLEWFLNQEKGATLQGFAHHRWNGVTTLQFAQLCEEIIVKNRFEELRQESAIHHYLPNETVNKYQLLKIMAAVFAKDYQIVKVVNVGEPVDRSLASNFSKLNLRPAQPMKTALLDLKKFMEQK
jgi:dTDP-4-dehydrorhamnose reductase